ncbi:MAG TPA: HAD family phosphatase [Povalibacter sp.]
MNEISSAASSLPVTRHSSPVSVVLFDVGGVLVQLGGVAATLELFGYRIPTEDLWRKWLHSPAVRDFESGRIDAAAFAEGVVREFHIHVSPQVFLDSFAAWPTGLFPGTREMIEEIPARYVRAVLSNSNALHWPRVEGDLGAMFDHYFVSHQIGWIKPDAQAFEHVLGALRCKANEVLFLDDNLLNVEAARRVGMEAFVVRGAAEVRRALQNSGVLSSAD